MLLTDNFMIHHMDPNIANSLLLIIWYTSKKIFVRAKSANNNKPNGQLVNLKICPFLESDL